MTKTIVFCDKDNRLYGKDNRSYEKDSPLYRQDNRLGPEDNRVRHRDGYLDYGDDRLCDEDGCLHHEDNRPVKRGYDRFEDSLRHQSEQLRKGPDPGRLKQKVPVPRGEESPLGTRASELKSESLVGSQRHGLIHADTLRCFRIRARIRDIFAAGHFD